MQIQSVYHMQTLLHISTHSIRKLSVHGIHYHAEEVTNCTSTSIAGKFKRHLKALDI